MLEQKAQENTPLPLSHPVIAGKLFYARFLSEGALKKKSHPSQKVKIN